MTDDAADGADAADGVDAADAADGADAADAADGADAADAADGVDAADAADPALAADAVDAADEVDLDALADREGWQVEGYAARVHYRGETDRYSVEYYAPSDCVLYWKVKGDGRTAVPVGRDTVPDPLRERVRRDLDVAGVDSDVEERQL